VERVSSLSTDRQIGMAMGLFHGLRSDRFASRYGLIGDDFDRLVDIIQAMDGAFENITRNRAPMPSR